ncbi:hypothetical protein GPALN_010583 [Globodera pallida]|nr:hypothetical protein GPALN_010583 [Globodera pallida]
MRCFTVFTVLPITSSPPAFGLVAIRGVGVDSVWPTPSEPTPSGQLRLANSTELAQTELAQTELAQTELAQTEFAPRRSWPDGVGSDEVGQTELARFAIRHRSLMQSANMANIKTKEHRQDQGQRRLNHKAVTACANTF